MVTREKIGDWLDERIAWRTALRAWLDLPARGDTGWGAAIGASVATCCGVLALTGTVLMTAYAPAPQSAWASVHYIEYVQQGGWVLRGLHYWAAQALLVLAAIHIAHGVFSAAYRKPREVAWWLTLAVLGLVVGEGITGGLLPWDDRGWWARLVEGNIIGLAPMLGGFLQQMMQGGPELGALGLSRAYTLHIVLLPILLALVLWARRKASRSVSFPMLASVDARWLAAARSAAVALAVVIALLALVVAVRPPLEAPADPMDNYPARPEWFLMTLFGLRKFFHGVGEVLGTTLLPGAAAMVLALLPWIDKPGRSRVVALAPAVLVFVAAAGIGLMPVLKDRHDESYLRPRAQADARAARAVALAMDGVPPEGALAMVRHDPELRGQDLFERHCAGCHVLGELGDAKKATAAKLDGWGTPEWIVPMIHDPDAQEFFGRGPYKERMPSVDVRPKDKPANEGWTPMVKSDAEKRAIAVFLASEGDEPGDPPRDPANRSERELGEKIVSERCTSCHLYKGQGDDEGSGLAPELARYGSLAWTRTQIANPASPQTYREQALDESLKKHMPRFDKELSLADLDLVARWTRAHARGVPVR
ncbi:MAG: cytochrome b N-terminal domain-containing protein [Myxococcota bacterium]|nr:cytochrome b N-terminal domain-containing protein [Myxococcota bacterium]